MKINVERKVLAGLITVLMLMAGIGLHSYLSIHDLVDNTRRASDAAVLRRNALVMLVTMLNLETGARGYVITGEDTYLDEYRKSLDGISNRMTALFQATGNAGEQRQRFNEFDKSVTAELAIVKREVELRGKQEVDAASYDIKTGNGKREMDKIRKLVAEVVAEQDDFISAQNLRGMQQARQTIWTIGLGSVCGFLFVAASCFLIHNDLARRRQAAERIETHSAALLRARDELEVRVQERTAELSRASELMRIGEARMGGIVNSAMDAIISVDSGQRIMLFNAAAERMFRCTGAEALGRPIDKFIPERFREQHRQHVEGFGETGVTSRSMRSQTALSGLRANGEEFFIEASISQVEIAGERTFTVILRDITERKLAADALREGEERFRLIVEGLHEHAIFLLDRDGCVVSWNAGAERVKGYKAEEIIGRSFATFYSPEEVAAGKPAMELKLAVEHGRLEDEGWRIRADGTRFWANVMITALKDDAGNLRGFSKLTHDITARKQVDDALRKSEAQLQTIVDNIDEAVVVANLNGELLHFNRAALDSLGYASQDEGRREMTKLVDTFELSGIDGAPWAVEQWPLARILRGEQLHDVEGRMRRIGASWERVFSFGGNLAHDAGGQPLMAIVTFSDISARKRGEQAVKASEARLNFALQASHIGAWELSLQDNTAHRTPLHDRIFGYDTLLPLWTYEMFLEHVVPEDRVNVDQSFSKAMAARGNWNFECRILRADGETRWIWVVGDHERDSEGKAVRVSGIVQDITERKRVEAALRSEEDRFRTMANSIPQLAWIARSDGFIFWYNERWYEYTGTTAEQMEGWGWQTVHDPQMLPKVMERWQTAIESGQPFEMEFPLRGADGRFRTFLTRIQPFKDSHGKVVQWFGTNTDVETLKQAEEKVRQLNTDLEQRVVERTTQLQIANKELESFSYSVSHDLRTPLRTIDGFSQALLDDNTDKLDAQSQDHLRRIRAATQRMGHLIDDLLNLARVTRAELRRQKVDLSKIACDVIDELRSGSVGREVDVIIAAGRSEEVDPHLLRIVLANLLGNAWKFTRDAGQARVEFGHCDEEGKTGYFVRDNGAGFDMAYAAKLFGAFQRLHTTTEFPGTGIGLATVQRIIHRHGGRVWAEGNVNAGATFYFTTSSPAQGEPASLAA